MAKMRSKPYSGPTGPKKTVPKRAPGVSSYGKKKKTGTSPKGSIR